MGYTLGIDVGTSFVTAAIADGGLEVVPLADDAVAAPAIVGIGNDGGLLTGAAAAAQGARRPDLVVRGIRRMLGSGQQVQLGGRMHDVGDLLGALLEDVLARVSDRRGAQPDAVALSYPATWDAGRRQLFEQVAAAAGIRQPVWTTEPAAAATCFASGKELSPGDVLAVYDLGAATFDATVLRRTDAGFETIGIPEQVAGVAGSRFDDLVLGRVNDLSYGALDDLEMRDPAAIAALERLRRDCARAKEVLSAEPEATISVALPNQRSEVQMTRGELEMLIQTPIESTIDTLDHVLQAAGVTSGALSGLLLVGGSSNVPLVAHRLAEAFGRPTVVGPRPEQAVALGAALIARERAGRMPAAAPVLAVVPPVAAPPAASPPQPAALPEPIPQPAPAPEPVAAAPAPVAAPEPVQPPVVAPAPVPEPAEIPRGERIPETAQPHEPNIVRDEAPTAPPAPEPPAAPTAGNGPVVVPTPARRAQRVTVVPARGGRTGPVAAPSGGDVAHLPFAPPAPPEAAEAAPPPVRPPEQPRPAAAFAPGGPAPGSPAPAAAPPPRAPEPSTAQPWTAQPWTAGPAQPTGAGPSGPFAPTQPPTGPPPGAPPGFGAGPGGSGPGGGAPPRRESGGFPSPVPPPPPSGPGNRWKLPLIIGLVVVLVAALGFGGYLLLRPKSSPQATGTSGASSSAHGSASASSAPATPSVAAAVPVPSLGQPIDVGKTPNFVVASPSGRQLYIASTDAGVVTVVDTAVNKVTATIPISAGPPQFLAFSPDGKKIYVSVWNTQRTIAAVVVVDTTTNAPVATIPVKTRPFLAAVSPDGKKVYVPNHDTGTISVIDATTNTSIGDFTVPPNPHSVAFTPDGSKIYAADHESNLVSVVDTATNKVIATIPVPKSPHNVAVHRTRPLAIVCSYDASSVTAIDTSTNKVLATIPVGVQPQHIAYSADGRFAYVTNDGSNTVSVINVDTLAVTATIPTGASPTSTAVLPNGQTGYVSDLQGGTLTVLNLAG